MAEGELNLDRDKSHVREDIKDPLNQWLDDDLLARFHGRIAVIDTAVMRIWGEFIARLERQGRTLPAMDSLIAAIALHGASPW